MPYASAFPKFFFLELEKPQSLKTHMKTSHSQFIDLFNHMNSNSKQKEYEAFDTSKLSTCKGRAEGSDIPLCNLRALMNPLH